MAIEMGMEMGMGAVRPWRSLLPCVFACWSCGGVVCGAWPVTAGRHGSSGNRVGGGGGPGVVCAAGSLSARDAQWRWGVDGGCDASRGGAAATMASSVEKRRRPARKPAATKRRRASALPPRPCPCHPPPPPPPACRPPPSPRPRGCEPGGGQAPAARRAPHLRRASALCPRPPTSRPPPAVAAAPTWCCARVEDARARPPPSCLAPPPPFISHPRPARTSHPCEPAMATKTGRKPQTPVRLMHVAVSAAPHPPATPPSTLFPHSKKRRQRRQTSVHAHPFPPPPPPPHPTLPPSPQPRPRGLRPGRDARRAARAARSTSLARTHSA
ncbi:hypothetical protein I4F81_009405 [Pyropia yezoensis]|uniref:Uncharacterized protein n=1 Tax=Pyropia yezoensis TaxID=2788 RepID=A0ACC3CAJ5_PYRYE|nr:hypothetical protein I4F81_009405 [Neopyropia yezoensis]